VGGVAGQEYAAPRHRGQAHDVDLEVAPELESSDVCGHEPSSALAGTTAAGMALLVAPAVGRFQPVAETGMLGPDGVVGLVTGGAGRQDEVRVPVAAEVCGILAVEGQMVQQGQPLAWLRQVGAGCSR